jgi:predicted O-methyltransferase YrrM
MAAALAGIAVAGEEESRRSRKVEYLEVGTFLGSSVISAMYGNEDTTHATVVENWAHYGGTKGAFYENLRTYGVSNRSMTVLEADFFSVDFDALGKQFDIYMYDAYHSYESQFRAITFIWKHLAVHGAIVVIDDWNYPRVRQGTLDGFQAVGANIVERFEITNRANGAKLSTDPISLNEFWNGIGIFIVV